MLRGKAPTAPTTHGGDPVMGDGELRYWSICSNQGLSNTRVNDCLFDEEIPLDANGFYTVIVSREEDKPRNAVTECGIGWLPMAEDGDGLFDPDVTVVQIRHMLTSPDFEHSVQRVNKDLGAGDRESHQQRRVFVAADRINIAAEAGEMGDDEHDQKKREEDHADAC